MIELLTTAEMAEADRLAIAAGTPGIRLMENAGRAVADAVARVMPQGAPLIGIVAGPGNNGGDGFVCARILAARGYPVRLLLLGERSGLKGDAAEAASRWSGPVEPATPEALKGAGLIVDALFGAGLDRPVEGPARAMIEAINAAGVPVVAVDLPSGINGTSGAVMGAAVRASRSVTFFRRKPGHVLLPGRLHCGPVEVADIGIADAVLEHHPPQHLHQCAGAVGRSVPGAAAGRPQISPRPRRGRIGRTCRTRARRGLPRGAHCGPAPALSPSQVRPMRSPSTPPATSPSWFARSTAPRGLTALLADPRLNALVLGPGGGVGAPMRELVLAALAGERAVVLDADALTSFAEAPEIAVCRRSRRAARRRRSSRRTRASSRDCLVRRSEVTDNSSKSGPRQGGGCGLRSGRAAERLRHRRGLAARPGLDRRERAALACHRGLRRRAGGLHRRVCWRKACRASRPPAPPPGCMARPAARQGQA